MVQINNEMLWKPSAQTVQDSEMNRFTEFVKLKTQLSLSSYQALYDWSISNKELFWSLLWDFFNLVGDKGDKVLTDGQKMPGAQWFPNAKLNFAENLLKHTKKAKNNALVELGENGRRTALSYQELYEQVSQCAQFLKESGVSKGDVVAGFLPNSQYAVIGMLAASSIGAIWTSCSPDFGINGVLDRFEQTKPTVLIATNGYYYGNKIINSLERVKAISKGLQSLKATLIVPYLKDEDIADNRALEDHFYHWHEIKKQFPCIPITFEQIEFNAPLYILYSSGTTGKPKCIVHSVGGTLLQHLKELALHTNVKPGKSLFYYTTCGWMMWNWLVSGLSLGATIILYDGSPFHPEQSVLFDIADQESINVFGASAKYYAACEKFKLKPIYSHELESVETFLSTGSPLSHESFEYLYNSVKSDVCVSSISGGTDIISCFALGNPTLPVYKGELQCIGLGMDVKFVDDDGQHLSSGKGELICKQSFPSMPTKFWNDTNNQKYKKAYFERFENVWAHGDYGELKQHSATEQTPNQTGVIIHGRSDAILNPGGVRIGTAEIYRQVEKIEEVFESIAIGQQWKDDVRVILFVRLQDDRQLDRTLIDKIKTSIRENTTPRHVPSKILQVTDIPRTLSGKIVELAVRKVVHGEQINNTEALANPEALALYKNLPELEAD